MSVIVNLPCPVLRIVADGIEARWLAAEAGPKRQRGHVVRNMTVSLGARPHNPAAATGYCRVGSHTLSSLGDLGGRFDVRAEDPEGVKRGDVVMEWGSDALAELLSP
jgi:hypothetical protein